MVPIRPDERTQQNKPMKEFTSRQLQAIESNADDIAVVAGPGSGKTATLIERVRHLMRRGIPASEITLISFTNAAAHEMVKRLECAEPLAYAGTLHGWVLRLLKAHGHEINLPKAISMLPEEESRQLRDSIRTGQKIEAAVKDIDAAMQMGPQFYLVDAPAQLSDQQVVAAAYYRALLESGVMDFDSLLKFGIWVLEKMASKNTTPALGCLFWDEVQDGGADDWRIMQLLAPDQRFVVGDPDQSIYGFRGARPDLFVGYLEHAGERRKVVFLEDNFRCKAEICRVASNLINWNKDRIAKSTVPRSGGEPGEVIVWTAHDPGQEAEAIVKEIRRMPSASQCAVLCRFNKTAEKIGLTLAGFGIPVAVNAKVERPLDWGMARAYISLLSNPRNDLLMHAWLVRQNGKKSADALRLHAKRNAKLLVSMLERQHLFPDNPPADKLPALMAEQGIGQESIVAVNNAIALLPPGASLAELSFAMTDEDIHRKQTGDGVTVTTIHSAKGREWDMVILPAFEHGILPSASKTASISEERRIAFVALTRARTHLVITNARNREPMYGRGPLEPTVISQFVNESGMRITSE